MVLLSVLLLSATPAHAARPTWDQPWRDVAQLVHILSTVPEGKDVLSKALGKNPHFAQTVKLGNASYTESTFSRTYSLLDGKEQITLHHEMTLNKGLSLADAVVDLAHELVHFSEKGMLDPYRPGFELKEFVRNGIEGEGGELAALAVECQVAWSLENAYSAFPKHKLCERYRKTGNVFRREAARRDYYAVGSWIGHVEPGLKAMIPEINSHATVFTSSYAGKPYPLALAEEYGMTRRAACVNNRRKFRLISSQSGAGRQPAASPSLREERLRLKRYEQLYCKSVSANDE